VPRLDLARAVALGARWLKAELALVLAEGTGRRLGAIRQLRWEDFDWDRQTIRWRAESDKKRKEWVVPVPDALLGELRQFQRALGAVGGWVFATEEDSDVAMDRHAFSGLLSTAEERAEQPKLDGGLWHPYRRKWATERKHLSLADVAAAGGWHNTVTLLTCYQQPTNDALLAVMSEERKVRDTAVIGGAKAGNG
jgi:integrase